MVGQELLDSCSDYKRQEERWQSDVDSGWTPISCCNQNRELLLDGIYQLSNKRVNKWDI